MNLFDMLFAAKVSGGGGGGSANSKETYTGTLDGFIDQMRDMIGTKYGTDGYYDIYAARDFFADVEEYGNANGVIDIDATALGQGHLTNSIGVHEAGTELVPIMYINVQGLDINATNGYAVYADIHNATLKIYMLNSGTPVNITSYASSIPYTLTLYWHEMPTA